MLKLQSSFPSGIQDAHIQRAMSFGFSLTFSNSPRPKQTVKWRVWGAESGSVMGFNASKGLENLSPLSQCCPTTVKVRAKII